MSIVPDSFRDRYVCVLGLGYVGLTLSVAMASAGFKVHGIEVREDVLELLRLGRAHFWEQGLEEKLKHVVANGNFSASNSFTGVPSASVYIITVGTPLNSSGRARLDMIENATRQICEHFTDGALVVLRSTVKIGTARNVVSPILKATGKRFEIAVCPERTLEGKALTELSELPQIIGSDELETQFRASQLFNFLTPTTVAVSALETAEVVKLIDNTYRDVMFGFGNEVARLCDAVGISATEVIKAGKLGYQRTNVAMPGPVGGPCLEKDPHILAESARHFGIELDIAPASRRVNERQPIEAANFIFTTAKNVSRFPAIPRICLVGLAFKGYPATNDLRGTMAKPMLDALRTKFPRATFYGFDPVVELREIEKFGLEPLATLEAAFGGQHLVVILNNHADLRDMAIEVFAAKMAKPGIIYDFWNLFAGQEIEMADDVSYFALGSQMVSHGIKVRGGE